MLPPVGVVADFIGRRASLAVRHRARRDGMDVPDLVARAARDQLPIPAPSNREGYLPRHHHAYWQYGLADYDKVMRAARERSITGGRFYDFGGSTGRVFRHVHCQGSTFEVWSSDAKLSSVLWNQRHMPDEIRCFQNGPAPPLPIPDRHFDVVTAFSVFTHIDELELPWLLELRRVLKPGGLLYVTVHDESFWERMGKPLLRNLQHSAGGRGLTARSPFPGPRSAFHHTTATGSHVNVFHSRAYVREEWGRYFDEVDLRAADAEDQCVVLMSYRG